MPLSLDPAHISKRLLRFVHTHPYQASETADAFLKGWEVVDVGTVMKTGEMVRVSASVILVGVVEGRG